MNDEQQPYSAAESPDGPLPNRLTRGTLMGCLGLAGVFALPLMLFLPLESWDLPRWGFLLVQLAAFCVFGGGIWLLAHMPSATQKRPSDPMHPLTARGVAPVLERPASWANRLGLISVWVLLLVAVAGFALAAFDVGQQVAIPFGMMVVSLSGVLLAAYGFCIALGWMEPPAFWWARTPATSSWLPQGGSVMLLGMTILGWALLVAAEARLAWGAIGLVVLLLATLLVAPTLRRLPARRTRLER